MRSQLRGRSSYSYGRYQEPLPLATRLGGLVGAVGGLLCIAGPLAYRLGLLSLSLAADRVFVWGATLAGIAALLGMLGFVVGIRRRRDARRGILRSLVIAGLGAALFAAGGRLPGAPSPPPIADVTTDTDDPPSYVTLLQLRGADAVAVEYDGAVLPSRQRSAYPDIQPLVLPVPRDEAFARAVAAVRELGWTLVSADGSTGRIEATAVTRLFGAVDDIVVRVTNAAGGSRVDVRSTSREHSGLGTSAAHVRAVLEALTST